MKKIVKKLAKEAGFIFWENEEWKPKGATIDWSNDYDKELENFFKLAVRYAEKQLAYEALDRMVAENQRLGFYDD